ncbi:MAG TPA: class I SAM-dependent methyltransferase [Tepidisphaeraceae bacterium]|jgi:cephalosporin hydroxylase|nr:class I SAM-dependent methyltransferase [Tepidisphaeraceae bacterium]
MPVIAEQIPLSRRARNDNLQKLAFHLSWIKKLRLQHRRRNLKTIHDCFRFSRKVFQLVQIEKEITGFIDLAQSIQPTIVCEIGTRSCGTSFMLSQAVGSVKTFIGLDLYVSNWSQFRAFARSGQEISALTGSSYADETVARVKQILSGRPIDVLFIDGDHSYAGAKKDFLLYSPFVREGGLIALHDIVPDHRARLGKTTGPYVGDVPRLWRDIKAAYPHHEFIADAEQEGFGIGAITYSPDAALPALQE